MKKKLLTALTLSLLAMSLVSISFAKKSSVEKAPSNIIKSAGAWAE